MLWCTVRKTKKKKSVKHPLSKSIQLRINANTVCSLSTVGRTRAVILRKMFFTRCTTLRTVLFWVVIQRVVVISYRLFGTIYRSLLQGSRWDRWAVPKRRNDIFTTRPVISQKSAVFICFATKPVITHRKTIFSEFKVILQYGSHVSDNFP